MNWWHLFKWYFKNQTSKIDDRKFVLNAITLDKIKWFGNLSIDDVINARENSCLQDFREILHKEINYMDEDKSINEVANQINYNLEIEFQKHQKELKKINNEFNLNYSSSSIGIIGGTISLLNGIFTKDFITSIGGSIALGGTFLSWINSVFDYNKKSNLINSPIGILFNARGDVNG